MRLIYYKSEPNVGDALNPWLWSRLLGPLMDDDPDHAFLGIGTILVEGYVKRARKITVFGSGARSRRTLPDFSAAEWDLRFVRGPRTARLTGAAFVSDPAIVLPRLLPASGARSGLGFVPHFKTRPETVAQVAAALNARVVSPALGVEAFVQELASCEKVVCEAMHGAIIADAYRIPWAGLRLDVAYKAGASNVFKWRDWCESIDAPYAFSPLPLICYAPLAIRKRFKPSKWTPPARFDFGLSPWATLEKAQDRILQEVELLKQETASVT
ncbi:polysaccharide pyruvyl transferase family protein [Tropicimonas sp. S265A]|uniref:polysaccharide pyruvyl transferase family protein n=1 Tax=Tropicimonas sp. S265A TaxID=3415134 RepID=UPI003C7CD199